MFSAQPLADLETLEIEHGLPYEEITPYQIRIDGSLDIYPTNKKWHDLTKNKRGHYNRLIPFVLHHFESNVHVTCPKCHHHFLRKLA